MVRVFLRGFIETHLSALSTVEDVGFCSLKVSLAHEFLLHDVLHVFNVGKGGFTIADGLGNGIGNFHRGFWIFLDGEESFSNSDLDFGL